MKHFIFFIFFMSLSNNLCAQFYIQAKAGVNLYFQSLGKNSKNDEYLFLYPRPRGSFGFSVGVSHDKKLFWDLAFEKHVASIGFGVRKTANDFFCDSCVQGIGATYSLNYISLAAHLKYKFSIPKSKFSFLPIVGVEYRFYSKKISSYTRFHYDPGLNVSMLNRQILQHGEMGVRYGMEIEYSPHQRHHIVFSIIHNIGIKPFVKSDIQFEVLTSSQRHYIVQQKGDFLGFYLGYRFFIIK